MAETEFSFLVEYEEGRYTVSSNDGGGTTCWDVEDVCIYMHQSVRVWCDDLREAEQERLAKDEGD